MEMWRITWRGLLSHWVRFVMTAIAIILGISFLVGSFVITDTIRSAFDDLFTQVTKGTDAVVRAKAQIKNTDFGDIRPTVPESLVATVRAVPGVRVAEGFIQVQGVQILDRHGKPSGHFAPQFGYTWTADQGLSPWRLASGRPPHTADEVVIDRRTANDDHYRVGDRVRILSSRPEKTYTVVGITRFGRVDSPLGSTAALFVPAEAQRIAGQVGKFDSIAAASDSGVTQTTLQSRLQAAIKQPGIEVLTGAQLRAEDQSNVRKNLKFLNVALGIFAGVWLLVGAFIIFNTFTIVVAQRTRELALLRAVGAAPRQVFRAVLGESALVGVIASALGVLGGVGLAAGLRKLLDAFGVSLPGGAVIIAARTVILGLVVGVAVTLLAAIVPARKAGTTPPIAALRDVAIEPEVDLGRRIAIGVVLVTAGVAGMLLGLFVASGSLEVWLVGLGVLALFVGVIVAGPALVRPFTLAVGSWLPRLRGTPGRLARDNAIRNPRRTSRTAIALTVGVALVGFITIFGASAKASVRKIFRGELHADYVVSAGTGFANIGFSPAVTERVAQLPQVEVVSGFRVWSVVAQLPSGKFGGQQPIAAVNPHALSRMLDAGKVTGSFDDLESGLAISKKYAKTLHAGLGSLVKLKFGTTPEPAVLPVVAIYDKTDLTGNLLISIDTFAKQHTPLNNDFQTFVIVKPGVTPAQMDAAMQPIIHDYPNLKLENYNEFVDKQAAQVDQVVAFIYVLLALAVIIALIGVANTLALSIYERTHEIGLLRAVGMSRRQVRQSVRWEAVLIALLGTVVGLVIGLYFGWAITASLRDQGFTEFDIAPGQLVIVIVVGAIAAIGAAVLPAWRAGRMNVLDAIHTE